MSTKATLFLVDDHVILREGLKALFADLPDIEIIGEANNGREALDCVAKFQPDVVLMDISMPGLNGIEATYQIRRCFPKIKVVILSMHEHKEFIFQALRAGAVGYVLKHSNASDLIMAIWAALAGGSFLSPSISRAIIDDYIRRAEDQGRDSNLDILTPRERETLQLLAEGLPNREIARQLGISVKTVERHYYNMISKLGVKNKADLIRYALSKGWAMTKVQSL